MNKYYSVTANINDDGSPMVVAWYKEGHRKMFDIIPVRAPAGEVSKVVSYETRQLGKPPKGTMAFATVMLSKYEDGQVVMSHTLCWRRGVSDKDHMRGIAVTKAMEQKPGYSVDSVLVEIVPWAEDGAGELLASLKALIPLVQAGFDAEGDVYGIGHNDALDAHTAAEALVKKHERST